MGGSVHRPTTRKNVNGAKSFKVGEKEGLLKKKKICEREMG